MWLSFRQPACHANDYRTEATSNQVIRILSLRRRGIHRQPAHVNSTNYNQINSTLDVMQRATKILSKKLHTNFYFWKHITLRVKKKSTSGELPKHYRCALLIAVTGKPGCIYFCHLSF